MHPPIAVFEDFIKGVVAETPATAINYLNAALTRQPSFDRARIAMWDVYADEGDHQHALAAVTPVPDGSPWAAYVDACLATCEKTGQESIHDNEGVVGTLVGGPRLI